MARSARDAISSTFLPPTPERAPRATVNTRSSMFVNTPTSGLPNAPPLTTSTNTAGAAGLLRVSHLFKALSLGDENKQNNNPFVPDNVSQDKLLQKHLGAMQQLRISPKQLKAVIEDDEQFRKIQQALRDRHSQTDALAKQIAPALIRERLAELQEQQAAQLAELDAQEKLLREEQRKLSIQRELTEARIKARQALNISLESQKSDSFEEEDDNDATENEDGTEVLMMGSPLAKSNKQMSSGSNDSPTSVTSMLTLSEEQFHAFQPGLVVDEDNSEDGDIQEVFDEE